VRYAVPLNRVLERPHDVILADDLIKSLRAPFSGDDLVTVRHDFNSSVRSRGSKQKRRWREGWLGRRLSMAAEADSARFRFRFMGSAGVSPAQVGVPPA
jgi:hypothetical protein